MQIITKSVWRRKDFFFHSSLWLFTFSDCVPRGLRAHFNFLFLVGSLSYLYCVFFPGQSNVLLRCVSFREDKGPVYSTYPCTEDSSDRKASSRLDEGWIRWKRSKAESEFVTVRRTETGDCRMSTGWWDCWRIFPLCASTNETRALIILTLFSAYDRGWHRLNHVYVPVLASVSTLRDTFYPITDCTCCWCTWVHSYKK